MEFPLRLLLVDDHAMFRESIVRLLNQEPDLAVVGQCASITDARRVLQSTAVDLVLLDYDLGVEVGTTLLDTITNTCPSIRVLFVTGGLDRFAMQQALRSGVLGLVLKHSEPRYLLEAIRQVSHGREWWDPALPPDMRVSAEVTTPQTRQSITERQKQVLSLILDGLTNKEIAARVETSETAVKASIQELFLKAGVRTRSQLVRIALEKHGRDWLGAGARE